MRAARVRQTPLFISAFLCLLTVAAGAHAQGPGRLNSDESSVDGANQANSAKPSAAANTADASTVSVHELSIPSSAQKAFDKGRQLLLDQHRAADSLAAFRKAVQMAPAFWEAHFLLGIAYMDLRKWSDAEGSLVHAIAFNDGLAPAYLALGSCLLEEGKYSEAEQQLLKGLELNPDAPHGQYDLSRTYYALRRFEDAKLRALKAIDLEPPRADVHFLLGTILLSLGDRPGALAQFQECLGLVPDTRLAALAQGQVNQVQSKEVSAR
jgi:tetratricopeptide (TPR) repeat protein